MKIIGKALIAISLSFIVTFFSFGFNRQIVHDRLVEVPEPRNQTGFTDLDYLQRAFIVYNHAYFHDELSIPGINFDEERNMASTYCIDGGLVCRIEFNPAYNQAPRYANLTLLHEMCHIKTWNDDQDGLVLGPDALTRHGKHWRACMLDLDKQGAWRNILIDFYGEQ